MIILVITFKMSKRKKNFNEVHDREVLSLTDEHLILFNKWLMSSTLNQSTLVWKRKETCHFVVPKYWATKKELYKIRPVFFSSFKHEKATGLSHCVIMWPDLLWKCHGQVFFDVPCQGTPLSYRHCLAETSSLTYVTVTVIRVRKIKSIMKWKKLWHETNEAKKAVMNMLPVNIIFVYILKVMQLT